MSGRSRPSSARTRKISLRGASGGSRSGTGSPDRRMTTNTTVGPLAELLLAREPRGLAKLVPARVTPVVLRSARTQEPPHHSVGIAECGGRVGPPEALERLVPILLGADGVLEHLDLGVDPDVAPHRHDGLRHRLVVGGVADGRLDDDLLALVAGLLQTLAGLRRIVGERRQRGVEVVVALGDG